MKQWKKWKRCKKKKEKQDKGKRYVLNESVGVSFTFNKRWSKEEISEKQK